jgi:hypothetical protein
MLASMEGEASERQEGLSAWRATRVLMRVSVASCGFSNNHEDLKGRGVMGEMEFITITCASKQ